MSDERDIITQRIIRNDYADFCRMAKKRYSGDKAKREKFVWSKMWFTHEIKRGMKLDWLFMDDKEFEAPVKVESIVFTIRCR